MSESEQTETKIAKRQEHLLSQKERARTMRQAAYQKAKEQKKKYLASPEVQKKLADRKAMLKEQRKAMSAKQKQSRSQKYQEEKTALSSAVKESKLKRQDERDEELKKMLKPALTLIKGGACE